MTRKHSESITTNSADINEERLAQLRQLFPEALTEGKVDFAKLRATLGDLVDDRPERYSFTWAGKQDAIRILQTPTSATLIPAPDESVDFNNTRNIFIEGDNLETLKLLYKSYFGRAKMIYIDPPYNTGNDFIYPDNYADPLDTYLQLTGQKDGKGNLLTTNSDTSGRYHSTWLTMMYPRLFLARQLLSDDGAIFISIGEDEIHNLRTILNEVFGEENVIATMVWQKSKRGDAKLIAQIHEYVLVAVKNKETTIASGIWRKPKEGVDRVLVQYRQFRQSIGDNHDAISSAMREWYKSLPASEAARKHNHYRFSDNRGLYFADNFAGPDDGRKSRPRYDIVHPVTGKPCKKPRTGWRWDEGRTKKALAADPPLIHFGPDETTVPCRKTYLEDVSFEPFSSVFYRDGRAATLEVKNLVGADVMDFPKNTGVLKEFIQIIPDSNAIVMDFFAGSCPTAQAVLELNREDGGKRSFIMIQLPELTPEDSKAHKAGFETIADIGKARLQAVSRRMKGGDQPSLVDGELPEDLGFKVFKLASTNFRAWQGTAEATPEEFASQMELFKDPLVEGWRPANVIYEIALKEGYSLNCYIQRTAVAGHEVYRINDQEKEQHFFLCLENAITENLPAKLDLAPQALFVCRDIALTDTMAANLALQCRLKTI
jgi:adenine-specific DNA-methyltransferase